MQNFLPDFRPNQALLNGEGRSIDVNPHFSSDIFDILMHASPKG